MKPKKTAALITPREVYDLYESVKDPAVTEAVIDKAVERLRGLSKEQLGAVADAIGLLGTRKGSREKGIMAIKQRMMNRKGATQRAYLADRDWDYDVKPSDKPQSKPDAQQAGQDVHRLYLEATRPETTLDRIEKAIERLRQANPPRLYLNGLAAKIGISRKTNNKQAMIDAIRQKILSIKGTWDRKDA